MLTQISLTPFDDRKTLRLIIDGASTEGVGFVLFPGFPIEGGQGGDTVLWRSFPPL